MNCAKSILTNTLVFILPFLNSTFCRNARLELTVLINLKLPKFP